MAKDEERSKSFAKKLGDINHNQVVTMQAAWIEWKHGEGADAAMQWIENYLFGPGLIPGGDEPYSKDPQFYHSANRSDRFPDCYCGNPSHILWMGRGFCCDEHYQEFKAQNPNGDPAH